MDIQCGAMVGLSEGQTMDISRSIRALGHNFNPDLLEFIAATA
jgi:hypothetical protein